MATRRRKKKPKKPKTVIPKIKQKRDRRRFTKEGLLLTGYKDPYTGNEIPYYKPITDSDRINAFLLTHTLIKLWPLESIIGIPRGTLRPIHNKKIPDKYIKAMIILLTKYGYNQQQIVQFK